jgi:SSS family solute:Na+ symporter
LNSAAAFWSITLSLITVIGWYIGSTLELASVFGIDALWPGLLVSIVVYVGICFFSDAAE